MKEQVTVGNLVVVAVFVFGLGSFQTRAEMRDAAHDAAIARLEQRLQEGEFIRSDVAEQRFRSLQEAITGLKETLEKGFARIERAVR